MFARGGGGVLHWGAGLAAEELLCVCDGHVRGKPRDPANEGGAVGWPVGKPDHAIRFHF